MLSRMVSSFLMQAGAIIFGHWRGKALAVTNRSLEDDKL